MDTPTRRIAVLIDADNASAAHARAIFEEVAKHGEANVRRVYGDMTSSRLGGWVKKLQTLAIVPQQQFPYTTGKNASDITLVIDAMDLMHTGAVDMFCLVSSDSDFTRLAQRLRESGRVVFGFGERKTPEAFRSACNRFIYLDNLGPAVTETGAGAEAAETAKKPSRRKPSGRTAQKPAEEVAPDQLPVAADGAPEQAPEPTPEKEPPIRATSRILKAMADLEDEDGWANLAEVGNQLLKIYPDFDPRTYGLKKLSDVVRESGAFEVEKIEGNQLRIRQI